MAKNNPQAGTSFDDFMKKEGIFDEVQAKAQKRALAEQVADGISAGSFAADLVPAAGAKALESDSARALPRKAMRGRTVR